MNNKLKMIIGIVSIGLITVIAIVMMVFSKAYGDNPIVYIVDKEIEYAYTPSEQKVADDVKGYLNGYLNIRKRDMGDIGNEAVKNYRTIMVSDMTEATDAISDAVTVNMMRKIAEYVDDSVYESFDIEAMASGCTELIWRNVLVQINSDDNAQLVEMDQRYSGLIDSLQSQIDDLAARKTKVNVNVKNNTGSGSIDIASIESMTETEKEALAKQLGISKDALIDMIEKEIGNSSEINKIIQQIQSSVKDGKDGKDGSQGVQGVQGQRGEKGDIGARGATGEAGKDGKDGSNGLSTYIFYADDNTGTNAGTSIQESSRYMQSVTAANVTSAKSALVSSGWVEYKATGITYEYDTDSGTYTAYLQ